LFFCYINRGADVLAIHSTDISVAAYHALIAFRSTDPHFCAMLTLWSLVPSCAKAPSPRSITYSCETGNKSNAPSWKENLCFACVRRCSSSIVW